MDMLNAVKSVSADVLSVSPSSEQRAMSITLPYICYVMTSGTLLSRRVLYSER